MYNNYGISVIVSQVDDDISGFLKFIRKKRWGKATEVLSVSETYVSNQTYKH